MLTPSQKPAEKSLFLRSNSLHRSARLLGLGLIVIALWGAIFNRWHPSDWKNPLAYGGDAILVMSFIKHAQNGDLSLLGTILSDKVGAPFTGNLNDFPFNERALYIAGGFLSHLFDPPAALNLLLIASHVFAALSFYTVARLWRVSRVFAWSVAIVYAFTPFTLFRNTGHISLQFYGVFPLQLYVCWYLASARDLLWSDYRFKLAIAIAFLSGFNNIYFVVPFFLFCTFSILRRSVTKRKNWKLALILPALTCLVTISLNAGFVLYSLKNGHNAHAAIRSYHDLELVALKPLDLLIPPTGQAFGVFDSIYSRYIASAVTLLAEHQSAYLGILGISGLIILFTRALQRSLQGSPPPLPALIALGVLAYSCFGGINALIGLISEFYLLRGTNRYSIILSSIALLYLAFSLDRWSRSWSRLTRYALVFILTALGLGDQALPMLKAQHYHLDRNDITVNSDRSLVEKLENLLPPQSMIFMLPVRSFPESPPIHNLSDYELLRPFLYSTQLRYSYGTNKGRPEADWQQDLSQLPAGEFLQKLEIYGFAGILLNRRAYPDQGESLLKEFNDAARPLEFEHGNEWVWIPLKPSTTPQLPKIDFIFGQGWYGRESDGENWWHWTWRKRKNEIVIKSNQSTSHQISFWILSPIPRETSVILNKVPIKKIIFEHPGEQFISFTIDLPKERNILSFSTSQPGIQAGGGDSRKLVFYIKNLKVLPLAQQRDEAP